MSPGDAFGDRWVADKSINTNVAAPTRPRSVGTVKSTSIPKSTNQGNSTNQTLRPGSRCEQTYNCDSLCGMQFDENTCKCERVSDPLPGCHPSQESTPQPASQSAGACLSRYQAELDVCREEKASAFQNCDQDKDSGLTQAKRGLSDLATGMGQQSGAQAACSGMGQALGAANAAVAAFTQTCNSAKNSCVSKCSSLKRDLDRELSSPTPECIGADNSGAAELSQIMESAISENAECRTLDTKVQQGVAAVNNTMGTVQGAMNCAEQLDTTLLYCKQNPNAIGCSVMATDCSNPTIASTSPICICAKNPSDPSCSVSMKAGSGRGGATDLASSAGLTGGSAGGGGADMGLDNVDWQGREWKKSNDTAEDPGGSKGGRPIQDGSAGNGSGGGEGGGAGGPNAVSVNNGFRGGGGGGGGGFYGGEGGSGSAAAKAAGAANSKNPDLRNFLPGGKFDPRSRGIAGISGPDGITGPHSNIWQKIQNRYQAEKPRLIP